MYRISLVTSDTTLLEVPVAAFPSSATALSIAARQARRHARSGSPVLLTGPDVEVVYWLDPATRRIQPFDGNGRPWRKPRTREELPH
ncbi:MAG: hypothetical protein ACK47B_17875 [Armatimonadota bacterium]